MDTVDDRLLQALAEQLKIPFIRIARQAELGNVTDGTRAFMEIEQTADAALLLVDAYLLGLRMKSLPGLELEPVSVTAALQDTAHVLSGAAKRHNCELVVRHASGQGPVMAHRQSLEFALSVLGYAAIESLPDFAEPARHVILGSHRSRSGVVTGVFGDHMNIAADAFRRARALYGTAHQAAPGLFAGSGAALFVADTLLSGISSPLRIARLSGYAGLAATFLPSKQLQLV